MSSGYSLLYESSLGKQGFIFVVEVVVCLLPNIELIYVPWWDTLPTV